MQQAPNLKIHILSRQVSNFSALDGADKVVVLFIINAA
jgi:hypothetical protein